MEVAMIDDNIVPIGEAVVSANDRGLYFGDGVYEVVLLCNGELYQFDKHMDRLVDSLRKIGLLDSVDLDVIGERIDRAVSHSKLENAAVYFHITRGSAARSHDYDENIQPGFLLTIREKTLEFPREVTAITCPDLRWKRCDIKSLNLLPNIMAKHAATKAGAYGAILVDDKGLITEASSASVLLIKNKTLQTPPLTANILPSITRAMLLDRAEQAGLERIEESFTLQQAIDADELILASTTNPVLAVTHLDSTQIGTGGIGEYTKQLAGQLKKEMSV
ncbi:aminotransferase class IV [Planctomycetota bacterium]